MAGRTARLLLAAAALASVFYTGLGYGIEAYKPGIEESIKNRGNQKQGMVPGWAGIPFLRRGARFPLERFHLERLVGRRGVDDFLTVGSAEWLARRDAEDKARLEAIDEAARALLCL